MNEDKDPSYREYTSKFMSAKKIVALLIPFPLVSKITPLFWANRTQIFKKNK